MGVHVYNARHVWRCVLCFVSVVLSTWEWKEDIDVERAQAAKKRAEEMIAKGGLTDQEYKMASAKLQRALVRLSVKK